jgi:hypothetical protein
MCHYHRHPALFTLATYLPTNSLLVPISQLGVVTGNRREKTGRRPKNRFRFRFPVAYSRDGRRGKRPHNRERERDAKLKPGVLVPGEVIQNLPRLDVTECRK